MKDDLPKGFQAGTAQANFKKAGRDDLGIIFSSEPCQAAALFTQNLFAAAPVLVDRKIMASGKPVRAIIANSGQANACTGETGLKDCREIQKLAAKDLGIEPEEIMLVSTGVIGARFDMDKWKQSLPKAIHNLGQKDAEGFTRAFMTTDAFPKFSAREMIFNDHSIRLAVMAKGAGMICPRMATMLCVCLTDAKIGREPWQAMFNAAVNQTFNRVSVDGDTSTNDTIIGLANGASGFALKKGDDLAVFESALTEMLATTAAMLVKDGEGAKKIMRITVSGAWDNADAELAARAIGNSQLVKTAIYGGDANWGRIINALGYSGARAKPEETSLTLAGIERFRAGQPVNDEREAELAELLKNPEITVDLCLGNGPGSYTLLASDLGHEYVTLNSDYRS